MNYLYQITLIGISIVTSEALSQAPKSDSSSRRDFVARSFFGLAALPSTPVFALKERDETLCKTGFFTNIWEFRCTDIGDISDEGTSRDLSSSELGATDSLMSKLNIGSTDTDEDLPTSNKNQIKSLNQDSKVRDKKRLF
mmetsp:Transcript_6265/g.9224  ORF Transcript_6265/g.9224 Transcript_6265/m.9224 type:complete len:140 (+) Transcript_6265:190-609(+)